MGLECAHKGHLLRLIFAATWGKYDLYDDYPNPLVPMDGETATLVDVQQWAFSFAPGRVYEKEPYFVVYDLLLWTMRKVRILE